MNAPAASRESAWPGPVLLAACIVSVAACLLIGARRGPVSSGQVQVTTFPEVAPPR